jgi:activator of HSP90 ATPase
MPESIHQEVRLDATRERVYTTLTDAGEFAEMTGTPPVTLTAEEGAPFSLFGGMITGRNIEVVPDRRLVQAWRAGPWPEGVYSVVRFQIDDDGDAASRIVLDHTGFPEGEHDHLAAGWASNYWEPLKGFLTSAEIGADGG